MATVDVIVHEFVAKIVANVLAQAETPRVVATSCSICIEPFNRAGRKIVTCEACHADICTKCIKRFLSETLQMPNCMNCRHIYTNKFMDESFSRTYRKNVLRNIRETLLVEREKQHLPELMHRADAYNQRRKVQKEIYELYDETSDLRIKLNLINTSILHAEQIENAEDNEKAKLLLAEKNEVTDIIKLNEALLKDLQQKREEFNEIYMNGGIQSIQIIIPCVVENCKGYLNDDFVCGLCDVAVCRDCREILEEGHTCKQENIDTVKAIEAETRPCPTCQSRIFKLEGCLQMFCTSCHTAFDWETGIIERGRVHNPHYFDWLRKRNAIMPREMGDVPCGGLPSIYTIQHQLDKLDVPLAEYIFVDTVYKMTETIQNKEIRKYPVTEGREDILNFLSIQYLAGVVTERSWKNNLFQLEKKKEINTEKRLLLDMMMAVLIDYFRGISEMTDKEQIHNMLIEVDEVRKYYNECIDNLCERFNIYSFKKIHKSWSKFVPRHY